MDRNIITFRLNQHSHTILRIVMDILNIKTKIYIRGHQKYDFLAKALEELSIQAVVNMEHIHIDGAPVNSFKDEISTCFIHRFGTYKCTKNNVNLIFIWLLE